MSRPINLQNPDGADSQQNFGDVFGNASSPSKVWLVQVIGPTQIANNTLGYQTSILYQDPLTGLPTQYSPPQYLDPVVPDIAGTVFDVGDQIYAWLAETIDGKNKYWGSETNAANAAFCCETIPSFTVSTPCPYGPATIPYPGSDCCAFDFNLGIFEPLPTCVTDNPNISPEQLCSNTVGGGGYGCIANSCCVDPNTCAGIEITCPALNGVILPPTLSITLSGCTGTFAALNGVQINATIGPNGWLVNYATPNGQITIFGYLIICCDATVPGLYFAGTIISKVPTSAYYSSICSCTAAFAGCPNATGEPGADPSGAGWESISGTPVFTPGSLFESLELTGGVCGSVDMNITAFIPPASFDCVSGTSCTDPGTGMGQYPTYALCAAQCGVTSPTTYNCTGSPLMCVDPGDGSGTFTGPTALSDCINSPCGTNSSTSYNCSNGFCVGQSGTGGQFPTYADCVAICSAVTVTSWVCSGSSVGVCTEVLGSSGYATQGLCNTACGISPPPPPPPPVPGCGLTGANQPTNGSGLINGNQAIYSFTQPAGSQGSNVAQWQYIFSDGVKLVITFSGTDWILIVYNQYGSFVGYYAQTSVTCGPPLQISFSYQTVGGAAQTMVFTA